MTIFDSKRLIIELVVKVNCFCANRTVTVFNLTQLNCKCNSIRYTVCDGWQWMKERKSVASCVIHGFNGQYFSIGSSQLRLSAVVASLTLN